MARGITVGAAAIAVAAFAVMAIAQQNDDPAQQRERPQQQQQQQAGERGGSEGLWNQAADLHRRIVQMEISQQQASPGQRRTPGQPGQREGAEQDSARNQPGQPAERGDNQPGQRRSPFTAGQSRSDALWKQLAEKHEQLVQMKLQGGQATGAQRETPERGAAGQERGAQREQPGRQTASATDQLEKEIGQLYIQILEADLADARGAREVLRPELNDQDPTPRPGQRTPEPNPDN